MARWLQPSRAQESRAFGSKVPTCRVPDACQDGAVSDKWQARNRTSSLSKALQTSYRLGFSAHNSLYARLWRNANPRLVPAIAYLLWDHIRDSRKLKTCTIRNALKYLKLRHGTIWNAELARRFQKPYLGKASHGSVYEQHRNLSDLKRNRELWPSQA